MAKKRLPTSRRIDLENISLTFIEENYISYDECLKFLMIKKATLQKHMRNGEKFSEPGDTLILPNGKRVFLREAVRREVINLFHENGVR